MNNTNVSLEVGKVPEYFPPEIIFDEADAKNCSPVVYFPHLLVADEQDILPAMAKAAWQTSKFKEEDAADELETRNEAIDGNSSVVYVTVDDDAGEETIQETPELKLARYGRQTLRVFGPLKVKVWETGLGIETDKTTGDQSLFSSIVLKKIDLSATEKLIPFPRLEQTTSEIGSKYELTYASGSGYNDRDNLFKPKYGKDNKEGFFYQQRAKNKTAGIAIYKQKFTFGTKEFERNYPVPCNRMLYQGRQVENLGRKRVVYRETLNFQNDTEKTIRFWYTEFDVTVIQFTQFKSADGSLMERRPNNYKPGRDFRKDIANYSPKPGATFYSEVPCYGSLTVEYDVEYTEYAILYDFPEPRRLYEVVAGSVEKVGYVVNDVQNIEQERGNLINGNDIGFDKEVDDPDVDDDPKPKVAVKLIKKIRFLPFTVPKIDVMYTNGRQSTVASFSPPQPDFMDLPLNELPRIAIYEKRRQELTPSGATVEHIEELTFLDVMGNVTTEKLEDRQE